jgi:hypothetical protein
VSGSRSTSSAPRATIAAVSAPGQLAGEGAGGERTLQHALERGPHPQRVGGGDEVQRGPHERHTHEPAVEQLPSERVRVEAPHARPQAGVGVERHLRLHADQVLDDLQRRRADALEQPLAGEQRPVQGAPVEHGPLVRSVDGRHRGQSYARPAARLDAHVLPR